MGFSCALSLLDAVPLLTTARHQARQLVWRPFLEIVIVLQFPTNHRDLHAGSLIAEFCSHLGASGVTDIERSTGTMKKYPYP